MASIGRLLMIGRFVVDGTIDSFTIDPNPPGGPIAKTIAAGTYYGYDPTGADSFLTAFQTQVAAAAAGATVTYDGTTGKVTCRSAAGAGTGYQITVWDDTDLRDMLGFTGPVTVADNSGATTATNQALFAWRANTTPTSIDDFLTEEGAQRSDARVVVAAGGQVVSTAINTAIKMKTLRFDALEGTRLHEMNSVTDLDWLSFWQRFMITGRRVRVYTDDRTITATTDYIGTYVASEREMKGPPQIDWIGGAQTVGRLQIELLKVVT